MSATPPQPAGLSSQPGGISCSAVQAMLPAPERAAYSPACGAIPGPASQHSTAVAGDNSSAATSSGGASIDDSCERLASASCDSAQTSGGGTPSSGTASAQLRHDCSSGASRPQHSAQLQGKLQCRSGGRDAANATVDGGVDSDQASVACSGALAACVLQQIPAGPTL